MGGRIGDQNPGRNSLPKARRY